jgi:hypothetical protein
MKIDGIMQFFHQRKQVCDFNPNMAWTWVISKLLPPLPLAPPHFVMYPRWWSSISWFSQIWLLTKYEEFFKNIHIYIYTYIIWLHTWTMWRNVVICWDVFEFFFEIWWLFSTNYWICNKKSQNFDSSAKFHQRKEKEVEEYKSVMVWLHFWYTKNNMDPIVLRFTLLLVT